MTFDDISENVIELALSLKVFDEASMLYCPFTKMHRIFGFWQTQTNMVCDQDFGTANSQFSSKSFFK